MYLISKKVSLLILAITSLVFSRAMFWFIDDPEGPNLLVVTVLALIVYLLSLAMYLFSGSTKGMFQRFLPLSSTGSRRILTVVAIQIILVAALYLLSELGF